MKTVLFTFNDVKSRDRFLDLIKDKFNIGDNTDHLTAEQLFVKEVLDTIQNDPSVVSSEHRHCSVWVSGKKIIEGDYKKMHERFMQECGVHSASVVLKELRSNEWCDIRVRRLQ